MYHVMSLVMYFVLFIVHNVLCTIVMSLVRTKYCSVMSIVMSDYDISIKFYFSLCACDFPGVEVKIAQLPGAEISVKVFIPS